MPLEQALADHDRVQYFRGNMASLFAAVLEDGVEIKAYFGWSACCYCTFVSGHLILILTVIG